MDDEQKKKPVSPEKLAANRENAKRSTGPRTAAGKQRASQNSYKHGFFGMRLFPNNKLIAQDGADYKEIYAGYQSHYLPVGFLENLLVEKIAAESLRIARLFGHEQGVLSSVTPFEYKSIDKILRYESTVSRQLEKAIDQLERLQEQREAETNDFEPTDLESNNAITKTDEATAEGSEPPEDPISGADREVSDSSVAPDAPVTTAQNDEAGAKQASAPMNERPSNRPPETAIDNPPAPENCASTVAVQTLTKLSEKADLPLISPAEEPKDSRESGENHKTNPTYSNRFIETAEDQELIGQIKRENSLESL